MISVDILMGCIIILCIQVLVALTTVVCCLRRARDYAASDNRESHARVWWWRAELAEERESLKRKYEQPTA